MQVLIMTGETGDVLTNAQIGVFINKIGASGLPEHLSFDVNVKGGSTVRMFLTERDALNLISKLAGAIVK